MDGNQDLSGMLQGVLNDPEAMKKIAALASGLNLGGSGGEKNGKPDDTDGGENETHPRSEPGQRHDGKERHPPGGKKGGESDSDIQNRIRLIDALKPYLSDERREVADTIVRVMKIIGLIDIDKLLGGF